MVLNSSYLTQHFTLFCWLTALVIPSSNSVLNFPFLSSPVGVQYTISSYVNGMKDIDLKYSDIVTSNNGNLVLFKDQQHDGM